MRPPEPHREVTPDMVSFHAVTRYCQRVLGVIVPGMDDEKGRARAVALAHCARAGTTLEAVRALIFTNVVAQTLRRGWDGVVIHPLYCAVLEHGRVTTIKPVKNYKRTPHLTDPEARRVDKQFGRRHQRRLRSMGPAL